MTRVVRPRGRPPPVISSNPTMPVGTLVTAAGIALFIGSSVLKEAREDLLRSPRSRQIARALCAHTRIDQLVDQPLGVSSADWTQASGSHESTLFAAR